MSSKRPTAKSKKKTRRNGELRDKLDRARKLILEAETSCNFFWGSHWVHRVYDDLEEAERLIDSV